PERVPERSREPLAPRWTPTPHWHLLDLDPALAESRRDAPAEVGVGDAEADAAPAPAREDLLEQRQAVELIQQRRPQGALLRRIHEPPRAHIDEVESLEDGAMLRRSLPDDFVREPRIEGPNRRQGAVGYLMDCDRLDPALLEECPSGRTLQRRDGAERQQSRRARRAQAGECSLVPVVDNDQQSGFGRRRKGALHSSGADRAAFPAYRVRAFDTAEPARAIRPPAPATRAMPPATSHRRISRS